MYKTYLHIPNIETKLERIHCFSCQVLNTKIVKSNKYKSNFLNKHTARESSIVQTYCDGKESDFLYNAKILYILQKLTSKKEKGVCLIGTLKNGLTIRMPEKVDDFLERLGDIKELNISFIVGKSKTKFWLNTKENESTILVSTRIYHSEEISSENLLAKLTKKINQGLECIYIFETEKI